MIDCHNYPIQFLDIILCRPNLRVIDKDSFSNLKQLVYLDLSFNDIETIDQFALNDNLKELDLESNKIKRIKEKMFCRIKRLNKLYVLKIFVSIFIVTT